MLTLSREKLARATRSEFVDRALVYLYVLSLLTGVGLLCLSEYLRWSGSLGLLVAMAAVIPFVCYGLLSINRHFAMWITVLGYSLWAMALLRETEEGVLLTLLLVPALLSRLLLNVTSSFIVTVALGLISIFSGLWIPGLGVLERILIAGMVLFIYGMAHVITQYSEQIAVSAEVSCQAMRAEVEEARDQRLEMRQMQADLVRANEELARLADRLAEMRRAAEEARRTKEEFVANVSHELRTPLNMIIGFTEMIVESPHSYGAEVPPALLADLNIVLRNSRHLAALIDDILDLSQIEADRWALSKERVPLEEVVEEAIIAVRPLYESKNLYLRSEVEAALPMVLCDKTRIREVILNLLSNSGRLTTEGGVTVRVERTSGRVRVAVADTGPGIAPEKRDRLFKPFEQLAQVEGLKSRGSGLGLSISKAFVELHGGKMWLESTLGEGTTFYFDLPIEPSAALAETPARWVNEYSVHDVEARPSHAPLPITRPRYVVVEEAALLGRLLERYLDGVEVVRAGDLEEAIASLADVPAQGLLINLPESAEMLDALRRRSSLPYGTPAICCSLPTMHNNLQDHDISDYLVKPISQEKLLSVLDKLSPKINTALIVDDDPDAIRLIHRMLINAGRDYRMLRARDGTQALRMAKEERPDVMLIDLLMPGMNGFQLVEAIREDPELADTPIVVVSARDPAGQPVVSRSLSLIRGGGLSVPQLLDCIQSLSVIAGPLQHSAHQVPLEIERGGSAS